MIHDVRIGLVQLESRVGEVEWNLNNILQKAEEAAKEEVHLLCYPECALQGYAPQIATEVGITRDSDIINRLIECSRDLKMVLLVGMIEKDREQEKPYISQLIVHPDKEPEVYRKVHLGRSEIDYFTAGNEFPVFEAVGVKFTVGICWDWHFPELAAIYSLKGAELQFAPHASPVIAGNRKEIWLKYLGARAYDNSVYLGACNLVGPNGKGKEFSGGAMVLDPKGEVIGEAFNGQEEILVSTLSAEKINRLRKISRTSMRDSFFLADRRKDLYKELIELEIK